MDLSEGAKIHQKAVRIVYTNWRGETARRLVMPITIWFGSTKWHTTEQWFVKAIDLEKDEPRDFALKDIKRWLG